MRVSTSHAASAAALLAAYLLESQYPLRAVAKQGNGQESTTAALGLMNIDTLIPLLGLFYSDKALLRLLESQGVTAVIEGERYGPATLQKGGQDTPQVNPVVGVVHDEPSSRVA